MNEMLALAGRLQTTSDETLITLLTTRKLADRDFRDFFDLADVLLSPESIQDALAQLDRPTLAAIAGGPIAYSDATESVNRAVDLMLLYKTGKALAPYQPVTVALESWPERGLPSAHELLTVAPPPEPISPTPDEQNRTDRRAAERACETTIVVTEVTAELMTAPARELAKGGLTVPDAKRLASATALPPETMQSMIQVASTAGLVTQEGASWYGTAEVHKWILLPLAARWGTLAAAWLSALSPQLQAALRTRPIQGNENSLRDYLNWHYPAGGTVLAEQLTQTIAEAEQLGIITKGSLSTFGKALLHEGESRAVTVLEPWLPTEVSSVYLQHDLTIVAPGPLKPSIDATLRAMTHVESRSIASSYRISATSVARALSAGYSAESIRSFLSSIAATGIPQPVDYLISDSSARHGLLRVGAIDTNAEPSTSYVRSDRTELLETLTVDQRLSSLSFAVVDEHKLVSRFPVDTVYWLLTDARYPVLAETSEGELFVMTRSHRVEQPQVPSRNPAKELVNRLRGSGVQAGVNTAEAWIVRQVDAAAKTKTAVLVTVLLPNGSEASFLVVPTSIASGRMRGIDQKAGVERTFPLTSITDVIQPGEVL